MLVAMIALPAATAIIAALLIWSLEKSRREAHHREAQVAADQTFDEARRKIEQKDIPQAIQKLKAYVSDENATRRTEAAKLLAEAELVASQNAASDTLDKMTDGDFERFQQSRHFNDARISHPVLC